MGKADFSKAPFSHSQIEAINRSASKKQVTNRSANVVFRIVSLMYCATVAY